MDLNMSGSFLVSVYRDLNVLHSSVQRLIRNVNFVIELTIFLCKTCESTPEQKQKFL